MRREIADLTKESEPILPPEALSPEATAQEAPTAKEKPEALVQEPVAQVSLPPQTDKPLASPPKRERKKSDWERFIGENLFNKIGIAITVIGVAIGAKYAIDNELISPLTRIVLGYLVGLGLLGFAIRLKGNYANFSAVLLSGAMAILYFLTYAAYDFYGLIPQGVTFVLMALFTVFTVVAALNYDRQVIAHIGLVGAYAVPFLLSDGSGRSAVLFSYMAIINAGILVIAFKKDWKALYYVAFGLTWLIYFVWFAFDYDPDREFGLAFIVQSVFFVTFYVTFLAYKVINKEKLGVGDIIMVLANSFIFYGLGYGLLSEHPQGEQLLGLFTLGNAVLHFIVATVIYRKKLADRNLFYLISSLVLVFVTLAVPVQLEGNWVTLFWIVEAAVLFWIGRTRQVSFYEKLSYPLFVLAFFSLIQDWLTVSDGYVPAELETRMVPFMNVNFLTGIIFIAVLVFVTILNRDKRYSPATAPEGILSKIVSFSFPALLLLTIYYAIRVEIAMYWNQLYWDSAQVADGALDFALMRLKSISIIDYSLLFVSLLAFTNIKYFKSRTLGLINLVLIAFVLFDFLTNGLYHLSELRGSYLDGSLASLYPGGMAYPLARYGSILLVGVALWACHRYLRQEFIRVHLNIAFDLLLHGCILWIASSELINAMELAGSMFTYKWGLSILWGVYSLVLIALGIRQHKKYLRIAAIVLFGITLLKLFFYDMTGLNTLSKTIVFVSLGVLLLIISFLYNKHKNVISDEDR